MKHLFHKPILWLLVIALFTTQCRLYYRHPIGVGEFQYKPDKRARLSYNIVLHSGTNMFELRSPVITENGIKGTVVVLNPSLVPLYERSFKKKFFRAKGLENKPYVKQLHLHISPLVTAGSELELRFTDIQKIEIIEANIGMSVLTSTVVVVTSYMATMIIAILIMCNCPHAYTFDGQDWVYTNSLYTGAVHQALERYDFKTLRDYNQTQTSYVIQLRNEQDEIQYTNELKLLAAYHPVGTTVVLDQQGQVYCFSQKIKPIWTQDDNQRDRTDEIKTADQLAFSFDASDQSKFAHLYASFETSQINSSAVMVIRAKNSNWGGFVYKQFTELFGDKYANWVQHNADKTNAELARNIDKTGILLDVEIKNGKHWERIDQIQLVGDLAYNNVAVKIPSKYLNKNLLEVRLKCGFRFWEIDELYLAQSNEKDIEVIEYPASGSTDVYNKLASNDDQYFEHRQGEPTLQLYFEGLKNQNRSLFIKSKGYYRSFKNYEGRPDYKTLLSIRKDGGLSAFSMAQFEEYMLLRTYLSEIPVE